MHGAGDIQGQGISDNRFYRQSLCQQIQDLRVAAQGERLSYVAMYATAFGLGDKKDFNTDGGVMKIQCCLTCEHYFKSVSGKMKCGYEDYIDNCLKHQINDFYTCESYEENFNANNEYEKFFIEALKMFNNAKEAL